MSVPYHDILAATALRINGLVGTDPVALETTYSSRPLVVSDFQSSIFPMSAIRDAILNAEQRLATAIADTGNHPWRSNILSETALLASGSLMPAVDVNGVSIIGIYGSVLDGADTTIVCTEQPMEVLRRRQLAPSLWIVPAYNYKMDGNGIVHTRTSVKVQVCVYDYQAQQAAFDANDDMLLPDTLAEALICGGVAGLVRDDEFMQQAAHYAQYFTATEQTIRAGLTSVSQVALGGPSIVPSTT